MAKKKAIVSGLKKGGGKLLAKLGKRIGVTSAVKVGLRSAGAVQAGLVVSGTIGEAMSYLDDQLTQGARSRDDAVANEILGGYAIQTAMLREAVARLTPEERNRYQQHLKELLGSRVFTRTTNPLFNAKQTLTAMMTALTRTSGKETVTSKKWENEFQRLQAANAVSKETPGLSEEQAYRDSFGGTALGIPSGRTRIADIPRPVQGMAQVGRALGKPIEAAQALGRWAVGDPEPMGPPPRYAVPGPGGSGLSAPVGDTSAVHRAVEAWQKPGLAGSGGESGVDQPVPPPPQRQVPKGAATMEDYIKAALRGAGFGSPEAQAYHYDPWGQTGGTAPYQAALTGNYAAFNPHIAGGQAPTLQDAQQMHVGTHQSKRAFADSLRAQGQAMAQRAIDAGITGYLAAQQSEGQQAGLAQKQALASQRNAAMNEKALYQGQLSVAANMEKQDNVTAATLKEAERVRAEATSRFADFLRENPDARYDETLQEEPAYVE